MATEIITPKTDDVVSWTASEYIDHQQGLNWFLSLGLITLAVAGLTYLLSKDIFGVVVILMLGLITGVFAHRTPKQRQYQMSDSGLSIDDKNYPYTDFKSFFIIQEGALTSINLISIKRFMPNISIYFNPADQEKIINILQDHLAYEQRSQDTIDRLTRSLRF